MIYPVALSFLFHESSTALVVVPVTLNDATFAILVLAASLVYSLYIVLPAAVLYALTLNVYVVSAFSPFTVYVTVALLLVFAICVHLPPLYCSTT